MTVILAQGVKMTIDRTLARFVSEYIRATLWSSTDDNEKPLDANYEIGDIAPDALEQIKADCRQFLAENEAVIGSDITKAAHDFWLTRNGHGAGFWDGDWPEEIGERLTEASKKFGECNLYVGDNGQLHI